MRKITFAVLFVLLFAAMLAVPASATKPTQVSGEYGMSALPANRTWRPAGKNCIVEVDLTYAYDGDLVGTSTAHYRIVSHGPCEENGPVPYKHHETLKARGTFVGEAYGKSGSFDFTYAGKVWPADPGELALTAHSVILSGTDDLANLRGWFDHEWIKDKTPTYAGQIHLDP